MIFLKKIFTSRCFLLFLFATVLNLFIFRGILAEYPSILRGDSVVVSEELVPIFDFRTQFINALLDSYNPLSSSLEFRVRYSWLTSWVRYYPILPAALVLLNALAFVLIHRSIFIVNSAFFSRDKKYTFFAFYSALAPTLLVYFLLLYSKITHFYTLIFGFSLFIVAISFLIEFLLYDEISKKSIMRLSLICVLTLINPAIHYIILTLLVLASTIFLLFLSLLRKMVSRSNVVIALILIIFFLTSLIFHFGYLTFIIFLSSACIFLMLLISKSLREIRVRNIVRKIFSLSLLCFLILLFYFLYYYFFVISGGKDNVGETVGLTRSIIVNASSDLSKTLTLQLGSVLDFFYFNQYYAKDDDRLAYVLYFFIASFGVVFSSFEKENKRRYFLFVYSLLFLSMFFAFGYAEKISAHNVFVLVINFLLSHDWYVFESITSIIHAFFNVLRYPHRFLFVFLICICFNIAIVLTVIHAKIYSLFRKYFYFLSFFIFILFFIPFFSDEKVFSTFVEGSFNGFLRPYVIPTDLKKIKSYLETRSISDVSQKMILLPSSELSFRENFDSLGNRRKMIDKFFIYYLNYPSVYYGAASEKKIKNEFSLLYFAILHDSDAFELLKKKGIGYILLNKSQRPVEGVFYRADMEKKIIDLLAEWEEKGLVHSVIDGDFYQLIQLDEEYVIPGKKMFLDIDWRDLLDIFTQKKEFLKDYGLYDISSDVCAEHRFSVLGNDEDKIKKDILALCYGRGVRIYDKMVPFSEKIVSSDDSALIISSLLATLDSPRLNNYNYIRSVNVGLFNSLDKKYYSLFDDSSIKLSWRVHKKGLYNLDIRAKAVKSDVDVVIKDSAGHVLMETRKTLENRNNYLFTFDPSKSIFEQRRNHFDILLQPNFFVKTSQIVSENSDYIMHNFAYHNLFTDVPLDVGTYSLSINKNDENILIIDGAILYTDEDIEELDNDYIIEFDSRLPMLIMDRRSPV